MAEGLYKKYGLDVTVPFIDGNAAALQALIAGQVDAIGTSPNSTLLTVGTSTPVQDVAVLYNRFYDVIVAKSGISSPSDLRGKKIGISQIGGQSDAEVLMALKAGGLTQADASRIQIGGQSDRVAALQAGSVDAIPVDGPTGESLKAKGFSVILDLSTINVPYAVGSLAFRKDFIDANPNTVLATVAAQLEATQMLFSDEDTAIKDLASWAQEDETAARADIDAFKRVVQRDFRWTAEGYKNVQAVVALVKPSIASVDPTQAYTTSILDRLDSTGFYKKLGITDSGAG